MHVRFSGLVSVLPWCLFISAADAQKKDEGPTKDKPAGSALARTKSPFGTIYLVEKDAAPKSLELYSDVNGPARVMTPPGQRGLLEVKEGDLLIHLAGNLPGPTTMPILDTVAVLAKSKAHDLEMSLERGSVVLEAPKASPGAKVQVRAGDDTLEIALQKGSLVGLERFSHWPAGVRVPKKPKEGDGPLDELWFFVGTGNVQLTVGGETHALTGPVLFRFIGRGKMEGPFAAKRLPAWLAPGSAKLEKEELALLQAAERLRRRMEKKPDAWMEALKSKDAAEKAVALHLATALGRIKEVATVLNTDAEAVARLAALRSLHAYSGRGVAENHLLHQALLDSGLKAGQANIAMYLLHGFTPGEMNRPETYESLIDYLEHETMVIRQLAASQLSALVPTAKDIAYDPAGPPEARARGVEQWRVLIPGGTLPKREK